MLVGFSTSPEVDVRLAAHRARLIENAGFDAMSYGDSPALFRDPYSVLTACALATERIALGLTVTTPVLRHPMVTASAIATVDEVSGGRAFLGIGAGKHATSMLGLRGAPIAVQEEYIIAVRTALDPRRRDTAPQGHVKWATRAVPIFVHASGPRALSLAERVGDGVLLSYGDVDDEGLAAWIREMRARRGTRPFEVRVGAPLGLAPGALSLIVAGLAASAKPETIPAEHQEAHRKFAADYNELNPLPLYHGGSPRAVELLERVGLLDYMTNRFACAGTNAEIHAWLDRMEATGVDAVQFYGPTTDTEGLVEAGGRIVTAWRVARATHRANEANR